MSGYLRSEENAAAIEAARAELAALAAPVRYRQRYECTCGFHGWRESHAPPAHIKCPRCGGVAVARGEAERVE
jgi:predicted RNA-binding Zn-ribbon protein involved in translation (DUF1610 family)